MGKTELKLVKSLGKKQVQNKDLLLAVRAKAFELETVISDLIEFGEYHEYIDKDLHKSWLAFAHQIYLQAGNKIKGA